MCILCQQVYMNWEMDSNNEEQRAQYVYFQMVYDYDTSFRNMKS